MSKIEFETIEVAEVLRVTNKAVLVVLLHDSDREERWIPLSNLAMHSAHEVVEGAEDLSIQVQSWFAKQEGLY